MLFPRVLASRYRGRPIVPLVVVALLASVAVSASADVTHHDLASAKVRLNNLYHELDSLVEQYDQAQIKLQQTQAALVSVRQDLARDRARARAAQAELDARARAAYESDGSMMAGLLGTTSFADLAAGVQDVQALAQQDTNIAARAQLAASQARAAAIRLQKVLQQRTALLHALDSRKQQIQASVAQATTLVRHIKGALAKQAAARRAAERAAAQAALTQPEPPPSGGPPLPPGQGAATAVAAARSVLGVPYVFGGASPAGFDCSGLTMWAWAHAGVALPHSAAMQYAMLPHVSQSDLQPGDLVFFYQPIDHVGIYIGGGLMIDADHTGGFVGIRAVYWSVYAGAARP
jgi:peptidoglycan DL-endopeptidase CwlO